VVGGARRRERRQRQLDVDRQAGRAADVRLEGMAEPAVIVLVAAQGSDDPAAGCPRKQAANNRRSSSRASLSRKRFPAVNASSMSRL
jgi:hypothetical protein